MSHSSRRSGQARRKPTINIDDLAAGEGSDDDQYEEPRIRVRGKTITITGVTRRKETNANASPDRNTISQSGRTENAPNQVISSSTRYHPFSSVAAAVGTDVSEVETARLAAEYEANLNKLKNLHSMFPQVEFSVIQLLVESLGSIEGATNYLIEESENPNSSIFGTAETATSALSTTAAGLPSSSAQGTRGSTMDQLFALPEECLLRVCEYLTLADLRALSDTTLRLRRLVQRYFGRVGRLDLSRHRDWSPETVVSTIKLFPALTQLCLRRCANLSGSLREIISATPISSITQLNLEGVQVRRHVARLIADRLSSSLETLILDGSGASDGFIEALCQPSVLLEYDRPAKDPAVAEAGLASLSPATSGSFAVTFPKLRVLSLVNCSVSDYGVSLITPEIFPRLREINLRGCEMSQESSIQSLLSLPQLETLNLSHCTKLTRLSLQATTFKGLSLRQLSVAACTSLVSLSVLIPWLVELTANDARNLRHLELGCPALGTLSLSGCSRLSSLVFKSMATTISQTAAFASAHFPGLMQEIATVSTALKESEETSKTQAKSPTSEGEAKRVEKSAGTTPKQPMQRPDKPMSFEMPSLEDEGWSEAQLRMAIERSKRECNIETMEGAKSKVKFSWAPKQQEPSIATNATIAPLTRAEEQSITEVLSNLDFPSLDEVSRGGGGSKAAKTPKPVSSAAMRDYYGGQLDSPTIEQLIESGLLDDGMEVASNYSRLSGSPFIKAQRDVATSLLGDEHDEALFVEPVGLDLPNEAEAEGTEMSSIHQADAECFPVPVIIKSKRGVSRGSSRRGSVTSNATTPILPLSSQKCPDNSIQQAENVTRISSPALSSANYQVDRMELKDLVDRMSATGDDMATGATAASEAGRRYELDAVSLNEEVTNRTPMTVLSLINPETRLKNGSSSAIPHGTASPSASSQPSGVSYQASSAINSPAGLRLSQTFESLISTPQGGLTGSIPRLASATQSYSLYVQETSPSEPTASLLSRFGARFNNSILNAGVESLFEPGTVSFAPANLWSLNVSQCHMLPQRPVIEMLLASSSTLCRFHAAGAHQLSDRTLQVLTTPPISGNLLLADVGGNRYMTEPMLLKLEQVISKNIELCQKLIAQGHTVFPGLASVFQKAAQGKLQGSPRLNATPSRFNVSSQLDSPSLSASSSPVLRAGSNAPRSLSSSPVLGPMSSHGSNALGGFRLGGDFTRLGSPTLNDRTDAQVRSSQRLANADATLKLHPILNSIIFSYGRIYVPKQTQSVLPRRLEETGLDSSMALLAAKASAIVAGLDLSVLSTLISLAEPDGARASKHTVVEAEYLASLNETYNAPKSFTAVLHPCPLPAHLLGMGAVQDTTLPALRELAASTDHRAFANTGLAPDAFESLGAQAQREHQEYLLLQRALQFLAGTGVDTSPHLSALSGFEQFSIIPGLRSSLVNEFYGTSAPNTPELLSDSSPWATAAPTPASASSHASFFSSSPPTLALNGNTPPVSPGSARLPPPNPNAAPSSGGVRILSAHLPPPPVLKAQQNVAPVPDPDAIRQQRLAALRGLRVDEDAEQSSEEDNYETKTQIPSLLIQTEQLHRGSVGDADGNESRSNQVASTHAAADDTTTLNRATHEPNRTGFTKSVSYDMLPPRKFD